MRGKIFALSCVVLCVAIGLAYALLGEARYRSEVVVARAEDRQAAPALSRLGGLASLVGVGLGSGGESQTNIAVLDSRALAAEFISSRELVPALFPRQWDEVKHEWRTTDGKPPPDLQDAVARFKKENLRIIEDKKSGLIVVAVVWPQARQGAELANAIVEFANAKLRKKALLDAQRNVDFLRKELTETTVASLQQSLAQLLESEMQKLLIARGNDEYAFKVVDAAVVAKRSTRSSLAVILVVSAFIGGVVGALMLILRAAWVDANRLQGDRSHAS